MYMAIFPLYDSQAIQDPNKPQAPTLPRLSQTGKSGACGLLGGHHHHHHALHFFPNGIDRCSTPRPPKNWRMGFTWDLLLPAE